MSPTSPLERAAERLNTLHAARPDVVRLAQATSIAVRVDSSLLRSVRLACVPEADVGVEADLWFSPLVESRGVTAIVFDQHVARQLQDSLPREPAFLSRVIAATKKAHASAPPALRLEEDICAAALRHGEAAASEIDALLRPALRAFTDSEQRGREIARWWLRAAPRLPAAVWRSDHAMTLLVGASVMLDRRIQTVSTPAPAGSLDRFSWVLPAGARRDRLELGIEKGPNSVTFRTPKAGSTAIKVPVAAPIVEISWNVGTESRRRVTEARENVTVDLAEDVDAVTIRTAGGAIYDIRTEADVMPTCFVVMGFGKKTDYTQNKTFDLDKSYRYVIKPAVEAAGYTCLRADEIQHAGNINAPLYEQIFAADLVIADLSTANLSAFFELGVRYGLRPKSTIVIAEKGFKIPFDLGQVLIRSYEHLGEGLDYGEVQRMSAELTSAIKETAAEGRIDSPVYVFLPDLLPPQRGNADGVAQRNAPRTADFPSRESDVEASSVAAMMDTAMKARAAGDFPKARAILTGIKSLQGTQTDPFVVQQLALVTYKSKDLAPELALVQARDILLELSPRTSTDPETLGLWGAVHKRLWERTRKVENLNEAIHAYERGFYVKDDYYNGVNLAYLLNVRAAASTALEDAIADFMTARRVRQRVVEICDALLAAGVKGEDKKSRAETEYWVLATRIEAQLGLDNRTAADQQLASLKTTAPEMWMVQSTEEQLGQLQQLLSRSPLPFIGQDAQRKWSASAQPQ